MNLPPPNAAGHAPPPAGPPRLQRATQPQPVVGNGMLQVAVVFRGQIIGYKLLQPRRRVTVGYSKRATFATPPVQARGRKFLLLAPKGEGYRLRLTPALKGELHLLGNVVQASDVLAEPVGGRYRGRGEVREVMLATG